MPKIGPSNFIETLPFCVLSDDGHELTGPMTEKDARAFLGLLEAVIEISRQYPNPDISHVDYRVGAKEISDAAYQAATGRTA